MQATVRCFSRNWAQATSRRAARRPAARIALSTLVAVGLAACQTARFAPPPDAARAALNGAALVATQTATPTAPPTPIGDPGKAAAHNAGEAGKVALAIGASGCYEPWSCLVSLALGAVVAPFALAGGAIAGASNAHGEAAVAETDAAIRRTLAEADLGAMLTERLLAPAMAAPGFALLPAAADIAGGAAEPAAPMPALQLEVTRVGFHSEGEIDPEVWLMVTVRGEVTDGTDDTPLYWRVWQYRGRGHDYFKLAENDGALLKAELDHAATRLADRIRQDLFLATAPERKRTSSGDEDTVWTVDAPLLPRDGPGAAVAMSGPPDAEASTDQRKPFWIDGGGAAPSPLAPPVSPARQSGPIRQPINSGPI